PYQGTAVWNVDSDGAISSLPNPADPLTALVDQGFPKGVAFSQWMSTVGASMSPGQISIALPRHNVNDVVAPAQRWIYSASPQVSSLQHYTFNTPLGASSDAACGRVLYSSFHVASALDSSVFRFPDECAPTPLTAQ